MQSYIRTSTAALLTGEAPQRIREKIAGGVYETRKQRSDRGGGNGGESGWLTSRLSMSTPSAAA